MNDFFCNVGEILAAPLSNEAGNYERDETISQIQRDIDDCIIDNLLKFDEITPQTLKYTVDDMEVSKSSGLEDIRSIVIKDTMLGNLLIWTAFINMCISTCVFPDILKLDTIIPFPKSGNLRSVLNWRPITLLPVIGKVIEKVLHQQLLNHAEEQKKLRVERPKRTKKVLFIGECKYGTNWNPVSRNVMTLTPSKSNLRQ